VPFIPSFSLGVETAGTVKKDTTILNSRADDVAPFASSEELVHTSGLPASALVEVSSDHRLAGGEAVARAAG